MKTSTTISASMAMIRVFSLVLLILTSGLPLRAQGKFVTGNNSGWTNTSNTGSTSSGIKVFPNPVKDVLNISLISPQDGAVEVYDRKMSLRKQAKIGQYEKLVSLDMSDLEGGTYYIVRILQGHKLYVAQVRKI